MSKQAVSRKDIAEAILARAEEVDTAELARQVAAYLLAEGRAKEIDLLARDIEQLAYRQTGTLEVRAESAHELTDTVAAAVKALFTAKQIVLHQDVNPSLIGGVRVQAQDQVLDLSVRTRLRQLRNSA
jgi:F-type H+-transporting ATPase subunit delta